MSLGRIALALSAQEIPELDLSSIDAVSALAQHTGWTLSQVSEGAPECTPGERLCIPALWDSGPGAA